MYIFCAWNHRLTEMAIRWLLKNKDYPRLQYQPIYSIRFRTEALGYNLFVDRQLCSDCWHRPLLQWMADIGTKRPSRRWLA